MDSESILPSQHIPEEAQSCQDSGCDFKVYDYVAILVNDGNNLLLDGNLDGQLALPEFTCNSVSASFAEIYLKELLRHLDIKSNAHVITNTRFAEYEARNHFVSLVITEITNEPEEIIHRFVSVSVDEALSTIAKTSEHLEVVTFLSAFIFKPDLAKNLFTSWYSLGYYRELLPSLDALLNANGHVRLREPQQVTCNHSAVIYRIQTNRGDVYFKALSKNSPELSLTRTVASLFPDMTLFLICVSEDLNAFVARDFGLTLHELCFTSRFERPASGYEDQADIATRILEQWAQIQQNSVPSIEELMSGGLPLFNTSWVRKGYQELVEFLRHHESLPEDWKAQADPCSFHVATTLAMWDTVPLPNTIVHGDLHEGNIAQPGGLQSSFIFFDWDSVFIGHPFLDLPSSDNHELFKYEHAYLRSWANYADLEDATVIKLADMTKPLQPLVSAIVEMKNTNLSMEIKNELVKNYVVDFCQAVKEYEEATTNI